MRILLVSFFFPPHNTIGGVRMGKMAKYLMESGHDVHVLTAARQPYPRSLPIEIDEQRIHATRWVDVNAIASAALGGRAKVAGSGFQVAGKGGRLARWLGMQYKALANVPDGQVGWLPFAIPEANRLVTSWRPDVIYASGTPWSSLLLSRLISRRWRIPWVAELRDLWADNPYADAPSWRKKLDQILERAVLPHAAAVVAVTRHSAAHLAQKYQKPTYVVLNGFDPEDFDEFEYRPVENGPLRIVYTGMIYEGRRDPSILFAALAENKLRAADIQVEFYGRYMDSVRRLASRFGVEDMVKISDSVSYSSALRLQSEADVLLLLLWDDPADVGVCPGKVFEYLGAGRPVLILGPSENEGATLLEEAGVGRSVKTAQRASDAVLSWIGEKKATGRVKAPITSSEDLQRLTRKSQATLLSTILEQTAGAQL